MAMIQTPTPSSSRPTQLRPNLLAALIAAAPLAACGSDDDPQPFQFTVGTTGLAAATNGEPLLLDGRFLAFRVTEAGQGAGGTDFNGDTDTADSIAVLHDIFTGIADVVDVAAEHLVLANGTLFMEVSEANDGNNWNMDGDTTDTVLLVHTPGSDTPVFIDTLADAGSQVVTTGNGRVIYAGAAAPAGNLESNLRFVDVETFGGSPTLPMTVLAGVDPNNDGISYTLAGTDGDIVFALADETLDGELNGDGDSLDTDILGALDGAAASPEVFNTGLAFAVGSTPTAVTVDTGGEWLVAFLVDEAAQGANLNDPTLFQPLWQPGNCSGVADTDQLDAVLHWFQLTDIAMGVAPANTGLVGAATGTAYALSSEYVGVVTPEAEEGSSSGCDLNGDSDVGDDVFRWVIASDQTTDPFPVTDSTRLLAVDVALPGGSGGVVRQADGWVLAVDEAADGRDRDGEPATDRIICAIHVPTDSNAPWNFEHNGTSSPRPIGLTWLSEDRTSPNRFFAAITEDALAIAVNPPPISFNADTDLLDSLPTVASLIGTSDEARFPGVQFGTSAANAGVAVNETVAFHRLSEAAQGATDLNGDGDANDVVLQRFSLTNGFPTTIFGTGHTAPGDAVVTSATADFGAYVQSEGQTATDLNGDGDTTDLVIRTILLP